MRMIEVPSLRKTSSNWCRNTTISTSLERLAAATQYQQVDHEPDKTIKTGHTRSSQRSNHADHRERETPGQRTRRVSGTRTVISHMSLLSFRVYTRAFGER